METQKTVTDCSMHFNEVTPNAQQLIIAGPCSAESPEQLLDTAKTLSNDGRVDFFRAGVWKPRTSPGSFQGFGVESLKWLSDVKKETGLRVATEVGCERHVYEALKYGVDLLWIGARTVSNPFTVQEIADAIRGVDVPVLVKNPLSPDIDLWEGAIKRFIKAGVSDIGAIHRGFTPNSKSVFRNQPSWAVPLMLKNRMPELKIICDPSHITGKSDMVHLIAQRALTNNFDGLMIEVHPNPDKALSDANQQINAKDFTPFLNKIYNNQLQKKSDDLLTELRMEIDNIDDFLLETLATRMELVKHIASLKNDSKMEVVQFSRWERIIERIMSEAEEKGLRSQFVKKLFDNIHKESCLFQKTFISDKKLNKRSFL